MKRMDSGKLFYVGAFSMALLAAGCGTVSLFNQPFLNTIVGGEFPITPGPNAAFVFVRVVNQLDQAADFIVTIERESILLDDDGFAVIDDNGNPQTFTSIETVRLRTFPVDLANEAGTLFQCSTSAVRRVGLGENLLPNDAAIFVLTGLQPDSFEIGVGFGVTAEGLNPLEWEANNFECGDTIVFRAIPAAGQGTSGNVRIETLLYPGTEEPGIFNGPSTFANYSNFLDTFVTDEG